MLSPDWVTGLEGKTVTCDGVTIKLSTSLPILDGYLTAICDKWENGKPISSIDSGHASIEHGPKTDSDLAGPRSKLAQVSSLGAQRAAGDRRQGTCTRVSVTRSEASHGPRMRLP